MPTIVDHAEVQNVTNVITNSGKTMVPVQNVLKTADIADIIDIAFYVKKDFLKRTEYV